MDLESRVFSQAESSQISDKYTAVRILGGNELDDEGRAFMARYGVGGYPTLLAMTADGAVLGRSFERTIEGILDAMKKASEADATFRAREEEIGKSQLPEALREMGGLYKDRMQWDKARADFEKLTASNPKLDDQVALLEVYTAQNATEERKKLLTTLVDTYKDNKDRIQWRIDLATADIPSRVTTREEFMAMMDGRKAALEGLVAQVKEPADQAIVRKQLADVLARLNKVDEAMTHWDWILEHAPDSPAVPDVLWAKAYTMINQGYVAQDLEKVKAARAIFQKLVDEHAGSPMASRAQRVLPQADNLIAQLEAKAKAAEEKKDGEEPKDGDGK